MKKIISFILALVMCSAFSVMCFAAPAVSAPATSAAAATSVQTTVVIDDAVVEEAFKQFKKMIDAESEARYTVAGEAMFALYSVIKENNVKDYTTLSNQMKKYAEDNKSEIEPVFSDLYTVQIIIKKFTVDGTFDLNKVQKEIEGSNSLKIMLEYYTGASIVKVTQAPSTQAGQTTMVENPKTGDSGVNTAVAFAVLGLGIGTIAVCAKKKES